MLSAKQEPTVSTRAVRGSWLVAGAIDSSVLNINEVVSKRQSGAAPIRLGTTEGAGFEGPLPVG